ncbi:ornithine cyclodeaminase family protein [Microbacterium sp. X-17]|uniref:ornithine cyclodeaminase family protein n=1 Tax=Microbacterium sp. X-17 TaxID=3144404 RepID=UPI0031F5C586
MTLYLDSTEVRALCSEQVALDAARSVLDAQRSGATTVPPRYDIDLPNGFFRVMPAAVGEYVGLKIMTLARGIGNRYLLLLYGQDTGDLIAVMDADEVTRLRTAATTAAAAAVMRPEGATQIGLIGTGFEAAGHLRAFAHLWPLSTVKVYSRSADKREGFAAEMSEQLGIRVEAVSERRDAVADSPVTLLCTKSTVPVVDGSEFAPGSVILSIGSTRPDLRELDVETLRRSRAVLVDDADQVRLESGDIRTALDEGAITPDHLIPVSQWTGEGPAGDPSRDLLSFKSVGTAVQDLLLAAELVKAAGERGAGRDLGELASLKKAEPRPAKTPEPASR